MPVNVRHSQTELALSGCKAHFSFDDSRTGRRWSLCLRRTLSKCKYSWNERNKQYCIWSIRLTVNEMYGFGYKSEKEESHIGTGSGEEIHVRKVRDSLGRMSKWSSPFFPGLDGVVLLKGNSQPLSVWKRVVRLLVIFLCSPKRNLCSRTLGK